MIAWLVKSRPDLCVARQVATHEKLGTAVAKGNQYLSDAISGALQAVQAIGDFARLATRWFPPSG